VHQSDSTSARHASRQAKSPADLAFSHSPEPTGERFVQISSVASSAQLACNRQITQRESPLCDSQPIRQVTSLEPSKLVRGESGDDTQTANTTGTAQPIQVQHTRSTESDDDSADQHGTANDDDNGTDDTESGDNDGDGGTGDDVEGDDNSDCASGSGDDVEGDHQSDCDDDRGDSDNGDGGDNGDVD
jgi:hypothetical protein